MPTDPVAGPDGNRPAPRRPNQYRPDLRPMVIIGLLLLAVVIGWVVLSPFVLPPPAQ